MVMRYCAVPAQMLPSMHAATGPKCLATAIAIGILVSVGRGRVAFIGWVGYVYSIGRGGVALTWRVGSYEFILRFGSLVSLLPEYDGEDEVRGDVGELLHALGIVARA